MFFIYKVHYARCLIANLLIIIIHIRISVFIHFWFCGTRHLFCMIIISATIYIFMIFVIQVKQKKKIFKCFQNQRKQKKKKRIFRRRLLLHAWLGQFLNRFVATTISARNHDNNNNNRLLLPFLN